MKNLKKMLLCVLFIPTVAFSQISMNFLNRGSGVERFKKAIDFLKRNKACLIGEECSLKLSAALNFSLGFAIGFIGSAFAQQAADKVHLS